MTHESSVFPVSDVEDFASHFGLTGIDADMFYESYYNLNPEDWDEDEYRENEIIQN